MTDWDDMERIWNWIYVEELRTLSEEVSTNLPPLIMPLSFGRLSRFALQSAPCPVNRSAVEPSTQPRAGSTDLFRNLQRTRPVHECPGGPFLVRLSRATASYIKEEMCL